MKKQISKIKISVDLDFIKLETDIKSDGKWGIVYRWQISGLTVDQKSSLIDVAKVHLFNETWKLTEMGYKVEVIPYLQ